MKRYAIAAAIGAVLSAVPLAALCGIIYRFPVPMSGYQSGVDALEGILFAALLYGILLGGFPFLAVLGAAAGAGLAWHRARGGEPPVAPLGDVVRGLLTGVGVAEVMIALLANLDYLIGSW
jgi:hypothetical protein